MLVASFLFLVLQVIALWLIFTAQRRSRPHAPSPEFPPPPSNVRNGLSPETLLGWEFNYASTTASEAMQDRHTMINYYLLVAGIVVSGVVTYIAQRADVPAEVGTLLLWLLCLIGWFYFLKLIRLRQAWHESVRAMNQIKEFYIANTQQPGDTSLHRAFLWGSTTVPRPEASWTVFHYSAMLIAFINSVAYAVGAVLLDVSLVQRAPFLHLGIVVLLGAGLFAFHAWLYRAMLVNAAPQPHTRRLAAASSGEAAVATESGAES